MSQTWSYNGVDLTTLAYNVRLLGAPLATPDRRGQNVIIPGRDGRLYVAKRLDERIVTLAMFVKDVPPGGGAGSEAQLLANIDALRGLFSTDGRHELRYTFGAITRLAMAEVVQAVTFQPRGPGLYAFSVDFLLADPFWYAETATTVGPTTIIQSPQNIAVNNSGTYKSTKPVITITGPITDPKFTIGTIWVQYTGSILAGETLTIDCGAFTADVDGTDATAYISHDGSLNWLEVPTGGSTFTVESSGFAGTTEVTLIFTPAYI